MAPGELVWLRAANGFGKTTLLRVVAGLSPPEAGRIEWQRDGAPSADGPRPLYIAHANALKDDLTVRESVAHLAALHGLAATPATVDAAIDRLGLRTRRDAPVRTLSQGQRRRVALARLCLSSPAAPWILDEPYDALDADGAAVVGGLLAAHAALGGNALFTSHVPPVVDGPAPRIVRLDARAVAA